MQSVRYELDKKALFSALKRHLLPLLITTLLGFVLGFGASYLQTPKWRATAQLDQPSITDLGNYYSLLSTYRFINGGDQRAYKIVQSNGNSFTLAPEISDRIEKVAAENVYAEFKRNLQSPDVLHAFLLQSESVKLRAQAENQPIATIANKMASQFSFQNATRSVPADRVNVLSTNPEEAQKLLTDFLTFVNAESLKQLKNELLTQWRVLFQQVKQAADLKLGAVQQAGQIASQDWAGKLTIMQTVQPLDNKLVAYRLMQTPSTPTAPISPNRLFWGTIGCLLGLLVGIIGLTGLRLFSKKVVTESADNEQ